MARTLLRTACLSVIESSLLSASIKKGINKGKWPDDFLKELAKPETVSENTHFNKDGAMLITEGLVELILKSKNPQLCELQSSLLHNVV